MKIIHNGVECGQMVTLAEETATLRRANIGRAEYTADAETSPINVEFYNVSVDLSVNLEVWRWDSVVRSQISDLTTDVLPRLQVM
ncbi:hypothetical protein ACFVAV_31000 [Nocardia sp. NPDC057663]|uniref:hypothetical protein n=1 Tax=Nocardia sp. NPDC057663 TaxID=3346201 RepID=UPI00366D580E